VTQWFIVEDVFSRRHGLMAEFCMCEEKEEGYCLCDDCYREVIGWRGWMEPVQ
jgi:hypothetical protein